MQVRESRVWVMTFGLSLLTAFSAWAQSQSQSLRHADACASYASMEGTVTVSAFHEWLLGTSRRFEFGLGARFTGYLGGNQYYITAPARLTSGTTGPQVLFIENIPENIDTFLVKSPQVNALNLSVNLGYHINTKISAGFNIDLIGFSLGGKRKGNYINGFYGKMGRGKPTFFNLLLVSDNDKGTLDSEFYVKYAMNERWSLKGGAQFLFTEYTTDEELQQLPEPNDRFRDKSLMLLLGVSRQFSNR